MFRSLKKRKADSKGRLKQPQYRTVPVPPILIEHLDLVFGLRAQQKRGKDLDKPLWVMSRATAWRLVKRMMDRTGITGKQATGKGLRHGFGVAMVTGKNQLPLHLLSQILGHSDSKTTEIYLQVVDEEKHNMVMDAWEWLDLYAPAACFHPCGAPLFRGRAASLPLASVPLPRGDFL